MKRRGTWQVLAMLLWLGPGWAGAQEMAQTTLAPAPAAEVRRTDPLVVTATRSEQPIEQTGASVSVVPEEAMRVQEYRAVEEVLRTIPGVQVQTSGSPGKLSTIRIRGANPTQVQVLIDGVRVKSLTSGDFDFADLTLDDIERIEVLRGPQSTLYGADAIGGVVNVITKRGKGPPSGFVDLEAGNYETFRERAGMSGSTGPWNYSLGVSRLDFGGQFDNDDHQLTSVNARLGYALPNNGEVSLTGRFQDGHTGVPFATVFPDFDPNRDQDQQLVAPVPRVAPALDLDLGAQGPGVGRGPDAHVHGPARSGAPVRVHLGHLLHALRGRVVPLHQARPVEHDHRGRRVPERGGRGRG